MGSENVIFKFLDTFFVELFGDKEKCSYLCSVDF